MNIIVIGFGMMGQAIAYDLCRYSNFDNVCVADSDKLTFKIIKKPLDKKKITFKNLNVENLNDVQKCFKNYNIAISAVPYKFNYELAKIAIETKTHFIDLGGNNDIVKKERSLNKKALKKGVTIVYDCGLAPGLTSVIVKDIVESMNSIKYVKIRVGGLPINPKPPLNYQIVFSPNGLINEYVEKAIILDKGKIIKKEPMTELEKISFQKPFGEMEAFLTSGGCSTLPYTYKNMIEYLDYKTIRYPGHCEIFKTLLDIGMASEKLVDIGERTIIPRDLLIKYLTEKLPSNEKDVVLLKVISRCMKNGKKLNLEYNMIDRYDEKNKITSMMRTTAYPTSIIAQMIGNGIINKHGVFGCEEIVPCSYFFKELEKRNIKIIKDMK
jgi:lysine 6-dehydrogenase